MISRRLVRIKAVQTYYAFVQGNYDGSLEKVWEALEMSIEKSYELFVETFCLMVAIADHAEYKIEFNRNKLLPTEEDLNPNRKFVDNRIIQAFRAEPTIKKYMENASTNWSEHYEFVRNIFNKMANSEFYKNYMEDENRSLKQDTDLICKIINKYLVDNEDLDEILETESIYWNDDIEFALSNLIQTIKKLNDDNIGLLNKVDITNIDNNMQMSYTIVSPHEANILEKKISIQSPIAQALLGKKVGDIVEVVVPAGKQRLRVDNIQI